MDVKQLKLWKATLDAEIKALNEKVAALTSDLQKKRQQFDLVSKLLDSESKTNNVGPNSGKEISATPLPPSNTTPDEVKDRVLQILLEANRPMNIKEIHSEFVRRGLPIPGKGTPFNILVHLSREVKKGIGSRFYKTAKGTYALRRKPDQAPREHQASSAPSDTPLKDKTI